MYYKISDFSFGHHRNYRISRNFAEISPKFWTLNLGCSLVLCGMLHAAHIMCTLLKLPLIPKQKFSSRSFNTSMLPEQKFSTNLAVLPQLSGATGRTGCAQTPWLNLLLLLLQLQPWRKGLKCIRFVISFVHLRKYSRIWIYGFPSNTPHGSKPVTNLTPRETLEMLPFV